MRFDTSGIGSTSFIELPQSQEDAVALNWTTVTPATSPTGLESLVLMCPVADYSVCPYFDDTGYIAGLQIAVSIKYDYFVKFRIFIYLRNVPELEGTFKKSQRIHMGKRS